MAWLKLSYPLSSLSLAWKGIFFVVFVLLDIVLSSSFNSTYNKSSLTCRDALLNQGLSHALVNASMILIAAQKKQKLKK